MATTYIFILAGFGACDCATSAAKCEGLSQGALPCNYVCFVLKPLNLLDFETNVTEMKKKTRSQLGFVWICNVFGKKKLPTIGLCLCKLAISLNGIFRCTKYGKMVIWFGVFITALSWFYTLWIETTIGAVSIGSCLMKNLQFFKYDQQFLRRNNFFQKVDISRIIYQRSTQSNYLTRYNLGILAIFQANQINKK